MNEVRTRFAPSPTGFLHIGGVRTALYAYLLARHHGGKFLLRIEDTDQERLVPGAVKYILEILEWFGILPDEGPGVDDLKKVGEYWDGAPQLAGGHGPYIQSLRLPRYQEIAEALIASGHAYRCDCSPEMLEKERNDQLARKELPGYSGYCRTRNVPKETKHVVRFKMPARRSLVLNDAVKGRVSWDDIPLRDPVLLKSDGFPTYHLAVVVDDHDMRISHVMRGDEWLASAPLHLLLYEALGWEAPTFAHLPVILGKDGKKLSKRDGSTFAHNFRDDGYLPEALLNYVALVGWSPGEGEEQEIFSKEELIKRFSLERVNRASGVFDYEKLLWMNGAHIRALTDGEFLARAIPVLEKAGYSVDRDKLAQIAPFVRERLKTMQELPAMLDFLFVERIERDMPAMFQKGIDQARAREVLARARAGLAGAADFQVATIEGVLRPLAAELGLKAGPMFAVVRIAVTGKTVTPPLFESLSALGKARTLQRIDETIPLLSA